MIVSFKAMLVNFVDNVNVGLAMSCRSRLLDSLRWLAIGYMEMGLPQSETSRRFNLSRSVVQRMWHPFTSIDSVFRIPDLSQI